MTTSYHTIDCDVTEATSSRTAPITRLRAPATRTSTATTTPLLYVAGLLAAAACVVLLGPSSFAAPARSSAAANVGAGDFDEGYKPPDMPMLLLPQILEQAPEWDAYKWQHKARGIMSMCTGNIERLEVQEYCVKLVKDFGPIMWQYGQFTADYEDQLKGLYVYCGQLNFPPQAWDCTGPAIVPVTLDPLSAVGG